MADVIKMANNAQIVIKRERNCVCERERDIFKIFFLYKK